MTDVVIRCFDTCTYDLAYPEFFLVSDKPSLRKIFQYMFRFGWKNEETIAFFDRELPSMGDLVKATNAEKIAKARCNWNDRVDFYSREYRDPKCAVTADEKRRIKDQNSARNERVKDAHAALKRAEKQAQKDLERVKEIIAIYQEAKTKFN